MVFRMMAVLTELESDQISERTKLAMHYKKSKGEFQCYGFGGVNYCTHQQHSVKFRQCRSGRYWCHMPQCTIYAVEWVIPAISNKQSATVKWFDNKKGFGFLHGPDGGVFVHYRAILGEGYKTLSEGQQVEYLQVRSDKGWSAAEVVPV